jgi:hypothetical protein
MPVVGVLRVVSWCLLIAFAVILLPLLLLQESEARRSELSEKLSAMERRTANLQ